MISFCSFEGVRYFLVKLYLFFQVTLCNQPIEWYGTGTFKPYSTPLWTTGFITVTDIELWWSVKDLQKNALKILETHSTVDILASDNFFFTFIFAALIDNPNNFKIVRLMRLVVSAKFLFPSSASRFFFLFFFVFFFRFDHISIKPSLNWTFFYNEHFLQQAPCFGPVAVHLKQFLLQLHINSSISASR